MHFKTLSLDESLSSDIFEVEIDDTVYLITGANKGIGFGLMTLLLQRPNTTIIACARQLNADFTRALFSIPESHSSSRVWACRLPSLGTDVARTTDAEWTTALSVLPRHPGLRIDVLVACAGSSPGYHVLRETSANDMRDAFEVNAVGPLSLFQTFYESLVKAERPKFVLISSALGSIEHCHQAGPSLAYGASKAAANYVARKIHCEDGRMISLAIHPGWVKTEMGQGFADSVGVESPPMTVQQSTVAILDLIDQAAKDSTSGKFLSYDGTTVPW
ncbi:MAG: hypothetical protein M1818_004310 [Claussenomyces sp. TS43310]|nr:MAG: hypothetical protein M1818_004310 [Claussenomyces sp. TS43310]